MKRLPLGAICAVTVCLAAPSDSMLAQVGPADRATAFFEALATQRWRDAAAMIHPDQRTAIRDQEMAVLVGYAVHRDEIRKFMEGTSSGGISLGSEGEKWRDELPKVGHLALPGFGDATTIRAAAELTPLEFVARLLAVSGFGRDSTGGGRAGRLTRRIIGTVVEEQGVAHVLYRLEGPMIDPPNPYDVDLLQLRRRGIEWFVWPLSNNFDIVSGAYLRLDLIGKDWPPEPE